ncbi:MAG: hypothetical protein FWG87_10810 [Defluviitaleaceae bacterium]|nr:hypothetical protein [Defluviitaleaceae bacterium]
MNTIKKADIVISCIIFCTAVTITAWLPAFLMIEYDISVNVEHPLTILLQILLPAILALGCLFLRVTFRGRLK